MKITTLVLSMFVASAVFATKPPKTKEKQEQKVFTYSEETGELIFSDTKDEMLKEIYFCDIENKVLAQIKSIDNDYILNFKCWQNVHHITILTDKTIHIEYIE